MLPNDAGATARTRPLGGVERVALVAEILISYEVVRRQLHRRNLTGAVEALRRRRPGGIVPRPLETDPRRLAAIADRVLAAVPGDARCLTRSLVVLRLLARRGIDVRLVIAARPTPTFEAHAWLERGGSPLLPTRGFSEARLTEL
jgi:hypothetical protein